jgi:hypothetical protein
MAYDKYKKRMKRGDNEIEVVGDGKFVVEEFEKLKIDIGWKFKKKED